MASTTERAPLLTRPFLLVAAVNLLLSIAGSFALHLPGFFAQLGAGEAEIGRIISLQALVAMAVGPLVGRVMDKRGRRAVLLIGCALYLLTGSLYFAIHALGPFVYFVRVLEGVCATMLYAALFTFAADVVPAERRTEGLALFGVSGLLPLAFSSVLGDEILAVGSYRGIFGAAVGFGALGFLVCLPLRDATKRAPPLESARGAWSIAVQRDLWPLWIAAFGFFFSVGGLFTFLKTYVLATHHGSVGSFFSAYTGMAIALRVLLGWLPDRVGPRRMMLPALLSLGLGSVVLAAAQSDVQVVLAGALCGVGHGYAYPVSLGLVVSRARAEERGSAIATYTAIDFGGTFASGPVLGLVIERAGYATAFSSLAALLALVTALFYAFDREPTRRSGA